VIGRRGSVLAMAEGLGVVVLSMAAEALGVWHRGLPVFPLLAMFGPHTGGTS
jgi:hypothetical protein